MTAEEYFEQGKIHYENKEYEKALASFDEAIKIDERFAKYWNGKGIIFSELKSCDKALECFDKAIALGPNYASSWNGKGNAYFLLKKYDKALECCNKAIELDPHAYHWNTVGNVYSVLKAYDKALESYDKAILLDPNDAHHPWNGKGMVYYALKEYNKALECYGNAIMLNKSFALPLNNKGIIFFTLKAYDKALECYDEAIEIDPSYASSWDNKGMVYHTLKKYNKALEFYHKATILDQKYASPWNGKGMVYNDLKEYDKAFKFYNKSIKIDPNYALPWNGIGNIYLKMPELLEGQRYQLAQIHYFRALNLELYPVFLSNYLKIWKDYRKHYFFLQDIFQLWHGQVGMYLQEQVGHTCMPANLWLNYLEKTGKFDSKIIHKTDFHALINYFMGHPHKSYTLLKDFILKRTPNNLQAHYYLIQSCYDFLENEEPYLIAALEHAEQYRKALQQTKSGLLRRKKPVIPGKKEIIQRYYAALIFQIGTKVIPIISDVDDVNSADDVIDKKQEQSKRLEQYKAALECIAPLWDKADFLPLTYLYYELLFQQKKETILSERTDKNWTEQDERGVLYADPFPKIAKYILKKEKNSATPYAFGLNQLELDHTREDWWQPLYYYAHYREISDAIDLLANQAKSHLNRKDIVPGRDLKPFWEVFTISPENVATMSKEIRTVTLQKTGQEFLNRAEVYIKTETAKIDKSEEQLKAAIYDVLYEQGDTVERSKKAFEDLEKMPDKTPTALVNRIVSKIEANELGDDVSAYLYFISYFLLQEELSPKESILLQFYALYAHSFQQKKASKLTEAGLKDLVKHATGKTFDFAMATISITNPVVGLTQAALKPLAKGSMGELFVGLFRQSQQKTMMRFNVQQYDPDYKAVLLADSFKNAFLAFVGEEKERLGDKFEETYPLYGFEDWIA